MTASRASIFGALLALGAFVAPGCGTDEGDVERETAGDSGPDHSSGGAAGSGGGATDATTEQAADVQYEGETGTAGAAGGGGTQPTADASDADVFDVADVDAGDAAIADASADVPVSQFCGDGIRDLGTILEKRGVLIARGSPDLGGGWVLGPRRPERLPA